MYMCISLSLSIYIYIYMYTSAYIYIYIHIHILCIMFKPNILKHHIPELPMVVYRIISLHDASYQV